MFSSRRLIDLSSLASRADGNSFRMPSTGWVPHSDMPLRMDDITEVRPAPKLPPDVQRQADRAQWVLYLLRRCVLGRQSSLSE